MVIDESPNYLRLSDGALLGAGDFAFGASSVDAIGRGAVPNALITDTPLVTRSGCHDPGRARSRRPRRAVGADGVRSNTPPPLTDGLPTPSTH